MHLSHLLFPILLLSLLHSYEKMEGEPDFNDDFNDEDTNSQVEELLKKYDPDGKNQITKKNYQKMLREIISATASSASTMEMEILGTLIDEYVESKRKKVFTFQDVYEDMNNDKLLQLIYQKLYDLNSSIEDANDYVDQELVHRETPDEENFDLDEEIKKAMEKEASEADQKEKNNEKNDEILIENPVNTNEQLQKQEL